MWTTLKKRSPHAHSHNKCKCQARSDIDQEAAVRFTSIRHITHIRRAQPTDSPEEAVIDAYRLRKCTTQFDGMISSFLARHPGAPKELKTKAFINGSQGWSQVDAKDRKEFLIEICDLAIEYGKIFAVALSFTRFQAADAAQRKKFGNSYWRAGAMFVAALLQRKCSTRRRTKGSLF